MNISAWLLLVLLVSGFALAGESPSPDVQKLTKGNRAFALDLYDRLKVEPGNLFLSPHSVSAALSMTREGAMGQTRDQMDTALHLPAERVAEAYHGLAGALEPRKLRDGYGRDAKEVPAYELAIANRLFGQTGYSFRDPFLERLASYYGAGLGRVDFGKPEAARGLINDWIEEQTRERIQNIIPPGSLDRDTRLVLTNAIYFKASWAEPFVERLTEPGSFTTGAGTDVEVPMMHRKGSFRYGERDGLQVLEMPYRGSDTSMLVLLPRAKDGLPALETKLDADLLDWLDDGLEYSDVAVAFPKFEFTTGFDLTEVLPAMGMKDAFLPHEADFSGMTGNKDLCIGLVLHKAFAKVDEAGTEAAAATVVAMKRTSVRPPSETVRFTADRPFLFLIAHRQTNSILFVGRVLDPSR